MKVVISAGGRFHALHLAKELNKHGNLEKLFTFDYQKHDHSFIPATKVTTITSCKIMNDWFLKLRLAKIIDKTIFNSVKDNVFDHQVSKALARMKPFDIFVGWAHYAGQSIQAARQAGAKIIIESGSCHIKTQQEILEEEYKKWDVPFAPVRQETSNKMQEEYEQADYIMTLSTFARNSFLSRGFNEKKVLMVPCGVDIEYFFKHSNPSTDIRPTPRYNSSRCSEPLGESVNNPVTSNTPIPRVIPQEVRDCIERSDQNKFRVIFVGLITLRKGLQYLIKAWQKANLPEDKTELIIIGAMQKDFASIMPKLPIKNNIRFIGSTNRDRLKEFYHSASVFVLPSLEDGFGMVIGEAMASRLPVICTTNTAAPDIYRDGECGFLVAPGNEDLLAEKISWCYKHKEESQQMGALGQKRIMQFSWQQYGATVHNVYQHILEKK